MAWRPPAPRVVKGRRRRFLERRHAHGLKRPAPLDVLVVNLMSASAGPRKVAGVLEAAASVPGVDVIIGSEAYKVDVAKNLGPAWAVWQDRTNDATAGSFIALRRDRGRLAHPHRDIGVVRHRGDTMRTRYVLTAELTIDPGTDHRWHLDALAGHAPPKRLWARWPAFMRAVAAQHADIAGADWNKLARAVLYALRRRVRALHILGLAVRWWIPTSRPRRVDVGGDHAAVLVTLWPARPKEKP